MHNTCFCVFFHKFLALMKKVIPYRYSLTLTINPYVLSSQIWLI